MHGWWECKTVQPQWKIVWRFLKKLNIKLPREPVISLLVMHPKAVKAGNASHCRAEYLVDKTLEI